MNKSKKNVFIIAILFTLIATATSLVSIGIITTQSPSIDTGIINTTLIINYGNNRLNIYNITIENATVFSVLMKASRQHNFSVEAKYFEQYQSHYIYSINSVAEGNNHFWQYYINGNYGTAGADIQPVTNNDYIEWRLQR